MATLTITINEETHGRLVELARERGTSVEELVAEAARQAVVKAEARAAAERHLAHYPEMFKRLAE